MSQPHFAARHLAHTVAQAAIGQGTFKPAAQAEVISQTAIDKVDKPKFLSWNDSESAQTHIQRGFQGFFINSTTVPFG